MGGGILIKMVPNFIILWEPIYLCTLHIKFLGHALYI